MQPVNINTFLFFISLAKSSVVHSFDAPISLLALSAIKYQKTV